MRRAVRLLHNTTSKYLLSRCFSQSLNLFNHKPLCVLSETEEMIKSQVSAFARQEIMPKVRKMDEEEACDPDLLKQIFDQGLMGIEIPEQYGGPGMNFLSAVVVIEELAKIDPGVAVIVDVQNTLVNNCILQHGTEKQKQEWLPRLASEIVGAFCLTEASSGSDAFSLKSTAKDNGDHWLLNGTKVFITNAKEAQLFIIFANVDPSKGYKGITAFLVDRNLPGVSVGKKENKLGIRASSTCEVILEDVKVPKDAMLGELGKGYKIAMGALNEGRIGIGSQMIGLAQGVFEYTMPYLQQRVQFGKPIAQFQGMEFQYAQAYTEIQAAKLLVYEAARKKEAKLPFMRDAAMAKLYAGEVACNVSKKCIEWLGGVGFTREFIAEKFYRDCIIGQIYEGTVNMNLMTIAKDIQQEFKNKNLEFTF